MNKKEMILNAIEAMGYRAKVDDDGDIFFRYEMKNMYAMVGDEAEPYVVVLMPQFLDIDEGEETLNLAACNKLTREVKMAKVYVDFNLKTVSASCEFFYDDEASLKDSLSHSVEILALIRSTYLKVKEELSE